MIFLKALDRKNNSNSSILDKSFVVLTIMILLISTTNMTSNTAKAASLPTGIVYSIPIILTNTQSVATPAPFQQMITVNSLTYIAYEATNLQNVEFFDSYGNVIPSWLESGNTNTATNTVYWIKIAAGIPADSSATVYLGFASVSTNLFNAQTIGEAPQLSPIYGEYDNGAAIFNYYTNFAGDSLPLGWAVYNPESISYSIHNELIVTKSTFVSGGEPQIYYATSLSNPFATVIDVYANVNSGQGAFLGYLYGPNGAAQHTFLGGDNDVWSIHNFDGGTGSTTSMGAGSLDSKWHVLSYFPSTSAANAWLDYAHFTTYNGNFRFFDSKPGLFGIGAHDTTKLEGQWFRQRALPPNGAMPTVLINSQSQSTISPTAFPSFSPTSTPHLNSPSSNTATTPAWGFDGAYAEYQCIYSYAGVSATLNVKYSVSNIDSAANKMDLAISYSGYLSSQSIPSMSTSISNPSLLPAVSQSDLVLLNSGQAPSSMSGAQVTTGVSINVPAGSFTTDRIEQVGGRTEWVDSHSGLIVQLSNAAGMEIMPSVPGISSPIQLSATNIPTSSGSSFLIYVILIIVLLAIVGVLT